LSSKSVALVFQIRAIDKKRMKKKIGITDAATIKRIDKMLKTILQI